jgi:hypothetical protein
MVRSERDVMLDEIARLEAEVVQLRNDLIRARIEAEDAAREIAALRARLFDGA